MPFEMDSTISIHAPREGGDDKIRIVTDAIGISIHAPARGATTMAASCRRRC